MSGCDAGDVGDGFRTALGMFAVLLPLIGGKRFEERKVCFAHNALQFDGFARVAFVVMSRGDPGVLIVGLNGGSRGPANGAPSAARSPLAVRRGGQHFATRPPTRWRALT